MGKLAILLWDGLGRWFDAKRLDAVAESCFRNAAQQGGKLASPSMLRLAHAMLRRGAMDEAMNACNASIQLDELNADAWCGLGVIHRHFVRTEDARRCFTRALQIDPGNLRALTNIGELELVKGDAATALQYFDRVLSKSPLFYEALGNRIAALIKSGHIVEAKRAAEDAVRHYPESAGLQVNLGTVQIAIGEPRLASLAFARALELEPNNEEARLNLAVLQQDAGALKDSVAYLRYRIELEGDAPRLQALLAMALQSNGELEEAEAVCRELVHQHPTYMPGWNNLAGICCNRGDVAAAIEYERKALELIPEEHTIFSNVAFDHNYLADKSLEEIFRVHAEWAERYEMPLADKQFQHFPNADTDKRLKIGYVSGDFHNHPVGNLLRGVLYQHSHSLFEIHCFSTSSIADDITELIRRDCDHWHDVQPFSVEELANLIHDLRIDILVDLSGHTAANRLRVFALKPAPIQVTWIGYFHSTGLASIDYFITDPYTTPSDSAQLFSEHPVRLPHTRFCYTPPPFAPDVSKSPIEHRDYVTFGSFNRTAKLTDPVIDAWARILKQIPDAILLLKARELGDAATVCRLTRRFEARGIRSERLDLQGASGHLKMLHQYSEVDIALDPFPFNGGMTTLEALWMGVPVVALAGNSIVARQSASMLANIGMRDLVYPDIDAYVAGAVALASDKSRLVDLRRATRMHMLRSSLCDAEQFTRDLEALYRDMWNSWRRGKKTGPAIVSSEPVIRKTLLHAGCGPNAIHQLPALFQKGWKEIRLDIESDCVPDILGSVLDMSDIQSRSVDAVYSSNLLQYLYAHEIAKAFSEIRRILKPNGLVVTIVPDLQQIAQFIVDGRLEDTVYESLAGPITPFDMLYGHRSFIAEGRTMAYQRSGFTLETLTKLLNEAGFRSVVGERRGGTFDILTIGVVEAVPEDQLQAILSEVAVT